MLQLNPDYDQVEISVFDNWIDIRVMGDTYIGLTREHAASLVSALTTALELEPPAADRCHMLEGLPRP